MHKVVEAKHIEHYKLEIVFETGEKFAVDVQPDLWGEMFEPLKNPDFFAKFTIDDFGGLSWPNGADYCADLLYMKMDESRSLQPSRKI